MVDEEYRLPLHGCYPAGHRRGSGRGGSIPQGSGERPDAVSAPSPSRGGRRVGCRVLALLLLAVPWGCRPPDRPPRLPGAPPEGILTAFSPEEIRALSPAPGTAYFDLTIDSGPWAVHLLRVDLGRCDLGLEVVRAPRSEELPGGRSPVTDLSNDPRHRVVAAVNGDFFTPEGLPVGTEVVAGDVRRIRDRPALAWRPGNQPWMGTPAREGDSILLVGWPIPTGAPDGMTHVVGAFPQLLSGGRRVGDLEVGANPSFAAARHPRTAVGFDPSLQRLWILVVDGRQPGYSDGMSLPELSGFLEALGATEAVNLDGGGSAVMVLRGRAVSRPSDAEGERPVVNALAVVRDPALCRAVPVPD